MADAARMRLRPAPQSNRLLMALPVRDRQFLLADCERIDLVFEDLVFRAGEPIRYVLFPTEGFISLVAIVDKDSSIEVGLVGNEGMLGSSLMLGIDVAPLRAVVRGAGRALRMDAAVFRIHLERRLPLRRWLNCYRYVAISQLAQAAGCTQFHLVEARLARRLLMVRDRAHADHFPITHEALSRMLGVRRAGITHAAGALKQRELIRYERGQLTILSGPGLEAAACTCYAVDSETYASFFGHAPQC